MVDEELLKPAREHLAHLMAQIKQSEADTVVKIQHWGRGDKDYAKERWREHYAAIEPLRREMEGVTRTITDYYALQADLPVMVFPS